MQSEPKIQWPHSSIEGEAEAKPSLPEAKPNTTVGVFVSNPAWRRYMRKQDVWESDND